MRFILILLSLFLAGLAAGAAGASFLAHPVAEEAPAEGGEGAAPDAPARRGEPDGDRNYVSVGRQLIVPVVRGQRTTALVLFEFAVDVPAAKTDEVHAMAPKLRDAFLRVLFTLSHTGAFDETYTDARVIDELRRSLHGAARDVLGDDVAEVLVLDVMRQEL